MSKLQIAVDKFSDNYVKENGEKPSQDTLFDGSFSRQSGESFCLCFKIGTGLGALISFIGLSCVECLKPVTEESYQWFDEAKAERREIFAKEN